MTTCQLVVYLSLVKLTPLVTNLCAMLMPSVEGECHGTPARALFPLS
jgi:hypothetical protein